MPQSPLLTKRDIKEEILKCGRDPIYFIDYYCKIVHKVHGLIPFKTWDFQKDLVRDFNNYPNNIILKGRQLGVSTLTAAYCAWLMFFHKEKSIMVIGIQFKVASNLVKKVKSIIKNLPEFFCQLAKIKDDNKTTFSLTNGSFIMAGSKSTDVGRSEALSLLVLDEAAHIENLEEIWAAAGPTMAGGGRCIAISTPKGVSNWFHNKYIKAEARENEFHPIKLMWYVHPERVAPINPNWEIEERKKYSARYFQQEYECLEGRSKINTPDGYKEIKNIKIGDLVLTHKGRFRKVIDIFRKSVSKNEIIKVSTPLRRSEPIYITKNHPIGTFLIKNGVFNCKGKSFSVDKINALEWKSFEELEKINFSFKTKRFFNFIYPNINEKEVLTDKTKRIDLDQFPVMGKKSPNEEYVFYFNKKMKRFIEIDYDFGKLIGLFLAEGNFCKSSVQLSFHLKETELHNFVETISNKLGIIYRKQTRKNSKCVVYYLKNQFLKKAISYFVQGEFCHNKFLKDIVYDTNVDFVKGIIAGVWLGDGLHNPSKKNILVMTSEKLIYQIRTFMMMFGLITRIATKHYQKQYKKQHLLELNNIEGRKIERCLDFFSKENPNLIANSRTLNIDDGLISYTNFDNVDEEDNLEDEVEVYNLHVEEDETYVAGNLVVHNCSFLASGDTVIEPELLLRIFKGTKEPLVKGGYGGNLWIWDRYNSLYNYLICADVARGDGTDFSTFHIFELETFTQVAEFKGKVEYDIFSKLLIDAGIEYGNAMVVVENNTIGYEVAKKIVELKYPNPYFSRKGNHEYVTPYEAIRREDVVPGFTLSQTTRPLIINKLDEHIRHNILTIQSERTYAELTSFIWHNGKPEAQKGYNDDLVIPLSIGCWVRDVALRETSKGLDYRKALLNSILVKRSTINTEIPGQIGYNSKSAFGSITPKVTEGVRKIFFGIIKG